MSKNQQLVKAKQNKNDEFYTDIYDIEKELINYKNELKNKIIYCNCDDTRYSEFYNYFLKNFRAMELKKIIFTHYLQFDLFNREAPTKVELFLENDQIIKTEAKMRGDGDFRSNECIEILKQSDIVITNPPFSLYRELLKLIIKHNKKFLLIGPVQSITYKNIFPLLRQGKMKIGTNRLTGFMIYKKGFKTKVPFGSIHWFTNLSPANYKLPKIKMINSYTPMKYPKFDNYNAINVNKIGEIPRNYDDLIGVPISFFLYQNDNQFEIIETIAPILNGVKMFRRIIIKRKK